MHKNLWIFNQYSTTPSTGMGGRSYYFAKELRALGFNTTLVSASHTHLVRRLPETHGRLTVKEADGVRQVLVRTLAYEHATSPGRAFNWLLYASSLRKLPAALGEKPDILLYSSPSPFGFLGARRLAKNFGARLVFDVRDIWPSALIELGGVSKNHPLIRAIGKIEKMAYRDSDLVMSNLKFAVDHMAARGMDRGKFRWIPNGILRSELDNPTALSQSFVDRWPKDKFVFGYVGTVGVANSMHTYMSTAKLLLNRPEIAFVVVGDGALKPEMMRRAQQEGLTNVHFFDGVPKNQVPSVLSLCDAFYIGYQNKELYNFGIGANKIPEYMYAQRPTVLAFSGRGDPIRSSESGFVVPAQDAQAVASAVEKLAQTPEQERLAMGQRGRDFAREHFSYDTIAQRLSHEFNELLENKQRARPKAKRGWARVSGLSFR